MLPLPQIILSSLALATVLYVAAPTPAARSILRSAPTLTPDYYDCNPRPTTTSVYHDSHPSRTHKPIQYSRSQAEVVAERGYQLYLQNETVSGVRPNNGNPARTYPGRFYVRNEYAAVDPAFGNRRGGLLEYPILPWGTEFRNGSSPYLDRVIFDPFNGGQLVGIVTHRGNPRQGANRNALWPCTGHRNAPNSVVSGPRRFEGTSSIFSDDADERLEATPNCWMTQFCSNGFCTTARRMLNATFGVCQIAKCTGYPCINGAPEPTYL